MMLAIADAVVVVVSAAVVVPVVVVPAVVQQASPACPVHQMDSTTLKHLFSDLL